VEDRASRRVYVMTTFLATVGLAALDKMMLGDFAANLACDTIRPAIVNQPVKASPIIGELALKILDRVFLHWGLDLLAIFLAI
jgi:hypothetical protein